MTPKIAESKVSRFDTKLPKAQKDLFEYAAGLGGYRTLTEFILTSAQEKADKLVNSHKTLLVTKRDQEIFFDALIKPPKPNKDLKEAARFYKSTVNKK